MKRTIPLVTALALSSLALGSNEGEETPVVWKTLDADLRSDDEEPEHRFYWKDGLRYEGPNAQIRIGGRIQNDWGWFSGDDFSDATGDPLDDGTEFRRARLFVSGTLYEDTEFKAQYDFAGDPDFKDVYVQLGQLWGLKIGHFKEPFGLEELTSSKYITFLERAAPSDGFTPSRNNGAQIMRTFGEEQDGTWAVGIFRDTDDLGVDTGNGEYAVTGRATWVPVYEDDGASVVHLGVAASMRDADDGMVAFGAGPEAHLLDDFIDTGDFAADDVDLYGIEGAWVSGPFSAQAEVYSATADTDSGDADQEGYYVLGSYFITGEHRPYDKKNAVFGRVKPQTNRTSDGGTGAIELAARFSHVDFEDASGYEDEQDNLTVGVNWYLNPSTRLMFNYVQTELDSIDEDADLFMIRLSFDF